MQNTFSEGIPYYTAGTAMLATASVSADLWHQELAHPVGILQGISLLLQRTRLQPSRFSFHQLIIF